MYTKKHIIKKKFKEWIFKYLPRNFLLERFLIIPNWLAHLEYK